MNRVFKVCMFVICSLLLLSSCDKDDLDNYFYNYKVKNREGFDLQSIYQCLYNEDTTFLTGFKNEKMWIGMFDEHTKEQLKEWTCTEKFNRKYEIALDYGEVENVELDCFYFGNSIYKTSWGFVAIPYYQGIGSTKEMDRVVHRTRDALFFNGDKVVVYPFDYESDVVNVADGWNCVNPCWFQESVLVGPPSREHEKKHYYIVISPEGKKIVEWEDGRNIGDAIPVSYAEGIFLGDYRTIATITRYNYQTGKEVWKTSISSLKDIEKDARINTTILEQSNPIWKYRIDITNRDGSKKQVTFTVDVETGKVTEI